MFKSNKVESIGGLLGVTRKIVIFTERTKEKRTYLVDFRRAPEIYQYLPDIYIFLQSMSKYHQIKKLMQSTNRINQ